MMTYDEFKYHIAREIKRVPGCICLECMDCGECIFWYEGGIKTLYNELYACGCRFCKGKMKVYGYAGEDAEL